MFIWTCDDPSGNTWTAKLLHKFNDVVWHVSWSITGNILAVSGGDNKVVCVYLRVVVRVRVLVSMFVRIEDVYVFIGSQTRGNELTSKQGVQRNCKECV